MSGRVNEISIADIFNDEDELDAITNDPEFDPLDPNTFKLIDEDGDEWLCSSIAQYTRSTRTHKHN